MRLTQLAQLAVLILATAAVGCGEPIPDADSDEAAEPEPTPRVEDPGLPTETTEFRGTAPEVGEVGGNLWVSESQPDDERGIALIAELRGLPPGETFAWAIHRGTCGSDDDVALALGWGTEAGHRSTGLDDGGGPLGEMRHAFDANVAGEATETVWIPFDEVVSREAIEAGEFSLRLHPDAPGPGFGESAICAPFPPLPRS